MDWNVIVTSGDRGFVDMRKLLLPLGEVSKTPYYDVLTMRVSDLERFLEALRIEIRVNPAQRELIGRVLPCQRTFAFECAEELDTETKAALREIAPRLAGRTFGVHVEHRGFESKLSRLDDAAIAHTLLADLDGSGARGRVAFGDWDALVALETVGKRAGLAVLTKEMLDHYAFLSVHDHGIDGRGRTSFADNGAECSPLA
jgi:hypothetical protein